MSSDRRRTDRHALRAVKGTPAATDTVQLIAGAKPEDRYDAGVLEERLVAFLGAGLLAPLAGARPERIAA